MARNVEISVKCPYFKEFPSNERANPTKAQKLAYKRANDKRIMCEGLVDGGQIILTFPSVEDKQFHKYHYCSNCRYERCPVARMLNKQYGIE